MAEGGISHAIYGPMQNILLRRPIERFPAGALKQARHPPAIGRDAVCCAVIREWIGTYDRRMTQLKRDDADTA